MFASVSSLGLHTSLNHQALNGQSCGQWWVLFPLKLQHSFARNTFLNLTIQIKQMLKSFFGQDCEKSVCFARLAHFSRGFQGTRPDHVQVRFVPLIGNLGVLHMALDTFLVNRKSRVNWEIFDVPFLVFFLRRNGRGKGN